MELTTIAVSPETKRKLSDVADLYSAEMTYHDVVRELADSALEREPAVGPDLQVYGSPDE